MFYFEILRYVFGATYPVSPALAEVTNATAVNPTWGEAIRNNINAIGDDLIEAFGDDDAWNGTPNTAGQAANIEELLENMRAQIKAITGQSNWYDTVPVSLETLSGGAIDFHPQYSGAVRTTSLRGASASGNNTVTESTGVDTVSDVGRHYYENTSAETSLQDSYIALRFTLPEEFTAWATSNAIQIEYRTESSTSINCHVDVYIFKSGTATVVASSENNASTSWATATIDDSALGSWSAGDIVEFYIKLETRNDYYSRVGKVRLNFTS